MSGSLFAGLGAGSQPSPGQMVEDELDPMADMQRAIAVEQDDGSVAYMVEDPTETGVGEAQHEDNLAEVLDEGLLAQIADEVLRGIEADKESVSEHRQILEDGLKFLGIKVERLSRPFPGASGAVHPLLMQSVVRWWSTARAELLPASGPVRTQVYGDVTQGAEQKARRKQEFLNYWLTVADEGYYPDAGRGFMLTGLYGDTFRKVYRDPITKQPRSRFVTPFELTVSYDAIDLISASRISYQTTVSQSELMRRVWSGYYRQTNLTEPSVDATTEAGVEDRAVGLKRTSDAEYGDYDIVEVQVFLDVDHPELAHQDKDGNADGLPMPWLVTIEMKTQTVLRLERDWRAGDPLFRRRELYAHYQFMPGLGFYGMGFIHLLGNCTDTASVLWRQAINAVTLFSFPGGLRVKGARPEDSNITVGPGEFKEVDTGGLPISQAVMPMPYRDVPASWAALLDGVVKEAQALGGTTLTQIAEGRQDAPVGTTLALIEQALRPESATLSGMHVSQRKEFRMIARLFAEEQDAKYPYVVDGRRGEAMAQDFADADDIIPVSDPNIPTQMQRFARAQAKLQLAQSSNGLIDVKVAMQDMLRTLGCTEQEIEKLMPEKGTGEPSDPVTEFAALLTGQGLKAGPTQSHQAHIMAHIGQLELPGLPPEIQQRLLAHIGEHLALLYAAEVSFAIGAPIVPGQKMPPEVEAQVSAAVAAVTDAVIAKIAPLLAGAGGDPTKMAEIQLKHRELDEKVHDREAKERDSERKSETSSRQDQVELLRQQAEDKARQDERMHNMREMMANIVLEQMKRQGDSEKNRTAMEKTLADIVKEEIAAASSRYSDDTSLEVAKESTRTAAEATKQHGLKVSAVKEGAKAAERQAQAAHTGADAKHRAVGADAKKLRVDEGRQKLAERRVKFQDARPKPKPKSGAKR